jgi:hypothetical protein
MSTPATGLPFLVLLAAFKATGATAIVVSYSGEGDSGGIDDVAVVPEGGPALPDELREAVVAWADEHAIPAGYENDGGGHGTVTFDLETMEAELEHVDSYEQDGDEEELPLELPDAELLAPFRDVDGGCLELQYYANGGERWEGGNVTPYTLLSTHHAAVIALDNAVYDQITGVEGGAAGGTINVTIEGLDRTPRIRGVLVPSEPYEDAREETFEIE